MQDACLYPAGSQHTAYTYEDTFTLGDDGLLSIYFTASMNQATVAGIEIMLPAVLRIDAGSISPYSDNLAPSPRVWQADGYFTGDQPACISEAMHTGSVPAAGIGIMHGCAQRCCQQQEPFEDVLSTNICIVAGI